jgi:hypothetical protein
MKMRKLSQIKPPKSELNPGQSELLAHRRGDAYATGNLRGSRSAQPPANFWHRCAVTAEFNSQAFTRFHRDSQGFTTLLKKNMNRLMNTRAGRPRSEDAHHNTRLHCFAPIGTYFLKKLSATKSFALNICPIAFQHDDTQTLRI